MSPEVADIMNGVFEAGGAVLAWRNVKLLYRDKRVSGFDWRAQAWWSAWGLSNLIYYSALNQPFSFWSGACLVSANLIWTGMAAMYANRNKSSTCILPPA